jgi:hypothetical protein
MKTIKILAIILGVLLVAFLALYLIFNSNTDTVTFEYRDMPYNFIVWKISDSEGNNPVMNYCLLEEADNGSLTFTILQDYSETAQTIALELKMKVNLAQGMLESFDMKNILNAESGITTNIHWNADFATNRLTQTFYVFNNRDGREEPRYNVRNIRDKPTWLYSVYLADMVVLLPYINTQAASFTASFLNVNNYTKLVFKRKASAGTLTYEFSPYGIFGLFSGIRGEFTIKSTVPYIALEKLSSTQRTGLWKDLLITVQSYQTIEGEHFLRLRDALSKGEKVNL